MALNFRWLRPLLGGAETPFAVRLFHGVSLLGAILSFAFVLPSNLLSDMPFELNLMVILNGLLMAVLYWVSLRWNRQFHDLFLYGLLISLIGEWFFNAGAEGPSPLFYGLVVIFIVMFYRGWRLVLHVCVFAACGVVLFYIEFRHPQYIVPYRNAQDRMMDWIAAFVITCASTAFVLAMVLRAYERAHERSMLALARQGAVEQNLREREALLQDAFNFNPDGLTITTIPDQRVIKVNDAWLAIFGYQREEVLGRTLWELGVFGDESPVPVNAPYPHPIVVRGVFLARDGSQLSLLISIANVRIDGHPHMLASLHNCTEIELMQRQMQEAQKMEAVGRLAGGVAHDVNNVMQSILLSAQLLMRREENERSRDKLNGIVASAQRGAMVASQLLAFSRQQPSQPRELDVAQALAEMRDLLAALAQENIRLIYEVAADAGRVHIDPAQFLQIIINLVINSRDAIAGSGSITVAACSRVAYDLGVCVEIMVSDTGPGVPVEAQPHIFEPFFTTKEVGKGTGLGLSTVYGIVQQNGGRVELAASSSEGASFRVLLPYFMGKIYQGPTFPSAQN